MLARAFAVLRSSGGAQGSVCLLPARLASSMGLPLPSRGTAALLSAAGDVGGRQAREQAASRPSAPRAASALSRPVWHNRQQRRSVWRPWKKAKTDELEDECHLQAPSGHRPVSAFPQRPHPRAVSAICLCMGAWGITARSPCDGRRRPNVRASAQF
jgi:hypothetical protein